jgi:hypothetical protein
VGGLSTKVRRSSDPGGRYPEADARIFLERGYAGDHFHWAHSHRDVPSLLLHVFRRCSGSAAGNVKGAHLHFPRWASGGGEEEGKEMKEGGCQYVFSPERAQFQGLRSTAWDLDRKYVCLVTTGTAITLERDEVPMRRSLTVWRQRLRSSLPGGSPT